MTTKMPRLITCLLGCPFCDRFERMQWDKRFSVGGDAVVAFPPLNPVAPGHMLVCPIHHVENAASNPRLTGKVFEVAAKLASRAGSPNLITSIGPEATQTVKHLHVHIVPRHRDDGLLLPWSNRRRDREDGD